MKRRSFLKAAVGLPAAAVLAPSRFVALVRAQEKAFNPVPGAWRTFEIVTRVQIVQPSGVPRVWLPIPVVKSDYQNPIGNNWSGNAKVMQGLTEPAYAAGLLYAEFAEGEAAPTVELTSRFETRDRAVDWSRKTTAGEDRQALGKWTASTELLPTDGIVRETALEITQGARTDLEKVKAVYDWTLATMYREPAVRGCGVGDIKAILETKTYGGKCADINALFVGLLRSVGVPARDVYGIRVAPSAFGYKAIGAGSPNITKAQHCRAEVFLQDYGWVAMDPADVAKVAREETSEFLKIDHPLVAAVRPKLFGGWEGNWVAFNTAHDVALPNATKGGRLGFLMYPQGETAQGRRDSLDPDAFKYTITAREIKA
jgi:transglutaminase-like putative cysteine protease